jgi:hypothetical protein
MQSCYHERSMPDFISNCQVIRQEGISSQRGCDDVPMARQAAQMIWLKMQVGKPEHPRKMHCPRSISD